MTSFIRSLSSSLRFLVLMTLVLGLLLPSTMVLVGKVMPQRADGSLISNAEGEIVGSALIGQEFPGDEWFQSRPSASDYDFLDSGSTNLSPTSPELKEQITQRQQEIAEREGVDISAIPANAVTASASGLDPDISRAYADLQIDRVAAARGMDPEQVRQLVEHNSRTELGAGDVVNVVLLNRDLVDAAA
ncbi:Potassium-transporting ATPase C chain [Corynebacterium ciconiae DSM 44920]|uniref:potassium-transporting ATPase subunit C n=1 Tax=Corynebacterium ciconiae TaxID=227319 RepID=UPI00035F4110|nr:potassium-transporting ATPase subunit C [Corynebacterium ciconiae]WKD60100.1 Potassium-transporting ATPase C chain [Corynebacterium ciconiae DSM 44920]